VLGDGGAGSARDVVVVTEMLAGELAVGVGVRLVAQIMPWHPCVLPRSVVNR